MTSFYGRGFIPDPAGHAKAPFAALLQARGIDPTIETPVNFLDLLEKAPKPFDQGQTGSCVGHAMSCAIYAREAFHGDPLPFVPSPKDIYTLGRALGRPSPTQKLTDDGAMPNMAIKGIGSYGIRPMVSLEGRFSDCDPSTINDEPEWGNLEKDALVVMLGTYEIANTTTRIDAIRLALSKGFPITCAVDASEGGPLQMYTGGVIESLGTNLDHLVCILGYETIDDDTVLTIRTSWNRAFGEDGNFRIGPKAIAQLGNLDVFDITKVVNP